MSREEVNDIKKKTDGRNSRDDLVMGRWMGVFFFCTFSLIDLGSGYLPKDVAYNPVPGCEGA